MEYQVMSIRPYSWEGSWVFDDPSRGLHREALVDGMPELIEAATAQAGIDRPEQGFVAHFAAGPFEGAQVCLTWVRQEGGGNVYRWAEAELEGWLCPSLLLYFARPPAAIFVELRPLLEA